MVKNFTYDADTLQALQRTLSKERLSTYLEAKSGNLEKALRLYNWNADISGALYAPLQGLEIALRNAIHEALAAAYAPAWYDRIDAALEPYAKNDVQKAKEILIRRSAPVTPPNLLTELSFGFWVSLLGGRYHQSLWIPALHKAFPNLKGKKYKEIHHALNHLRKLRNRIAHHEPIFNRHLSADYESIIAAIDWVCPRTAVWVDNHNIFRAVLHRFNQDGEDV